MDKSKLLKDAIVDAKAVKEAALANAKAAIAEAFTPKLKEMFSKKIQEMEDEDSIDEELYGDEHEIPTDDAVDSMDESFLFEEEDEAEEAEEETEEVEDEASEDEESEEDETIDLEDMSESDLTSFIEDIVKDMASSGELEGSVDEPAGDEGDMEGMDDMDLGGDEGGEDMGDMDLGSDEGGEGEEVNLQELFSDYRRKKLIESKRKKHIQEVSKTKFRKSINPVALNEAKMRAEITKLKQEINEVNVLNAKLTYTNKLFKAKSLTEAQKVKVLSAFDKASTAKEAKLVYESLLTSLSTTVKNPIKESRGTASNIVKGQITESKKSIIETDPQVLRMMKLAGLK